MAQYRFNHQTRIERGCQTSIKRDNLTPAAVCMLVRQALDVHTLAISFVYCASRKILLEGQVGKRENIRAPLNEEASAMPKVSKERLCSFRTLQRCGEDFLDL